MTTENSSAEVLGPLFSDEELIFQYTEASRMQRFLNYLIDILLLNFGLSTITGYAVGYFLANLFPEFAFAAFTEKGFSYYAIIYLVWFCNITLYYTFCEKLFKGYTLGKLITGSRAIRQDGKELTWKDAFLRSVIRIVPFEPFSGLTDPWHDNWTHTMVVRTRE